jgi:uncharacterized Zn-finger protein
MAVLPQPCLDPHLLRIWWPLTHWTFRSCSYCVNSYVVATITLKHSGEHLFSCRGHSSSTSSYHPRHSLQSLHSQVKRPAPLHNLGKPRVLSKLQVGFQSAKRRCGIPTPSRIFCNSCEFPRPFSFHVAREATLVLRESCCCQVLSATVYARDPRAYHHSSSIDGM